MFSDSKTTEMHDALSKEIGTGDRVYLTDEYYEDFKATIVEVPPFGWKVKSHTDTVATIEFHRPNLKMQIQLEVEARYLKREI